MVRARRLAAALDFLDALVALLPSRMDLWWLVMVIGVPLRRESLRTVVYTMDVV